MGKLGFGELELLILKIVRDKGKVSVRDVYTSLGNKGSYTTIMTVMSRMADKGELMKKKDGKQYFYWVEATNQIPSKNILRRIQDKIFHGKSTAMVSYLLEADQEISDQELAEMEKLIQKYRADKKRG